MHRKAQGNAPGRVNRLVGMYMAISNVLERMKYTESQITTLHPRPNEVRRMAEYWAALQLYDELSTLFETTLKPNADDRIDIKDDTIDSIMASIESYHDAEEKLLQSIVREYPKFRHAIPATFTWRPEIACHGTHLAPDVLRWLTTAEENWTSKRLLCLTPSLKHHMMARVGELAGQLVNNNMIKFGSQLASITFASNMFSVGTMLADKYVVRIVRGHSLALRGAKRRRRRKRTMSRIERRSKIQSPIQCSIRHQSRLQTRSYRQLGQVRAALR